MVHLVHIADLMADALGFAVLKPIERQSFQEVLELLPAQARDRFAPEPDRLAAEIDTRIQSWE
jgi:hypothetical protein